MLDVFSLQSLQRSYFKQSPSSYRSGPRLQLHQLVRTHRAVIPRGESVRAHRGAVRGLSGDPHAEQARSVHRSAGRVAQSWYAKIVCLNLRNGITIRRCWMPSSAFLSAP